MRRLIGFVTIIAPLLVPTAGWKSYNETLALLPASRLWVDGSSSIKSWSCKAGEVNAVVEAAGSGAVDKVLAGEKAVRTVQVIVPAEKLECGNGTMNEHMRKALKVEEFKTIAFKLATYTVSKAAPGVAGTLNGTLTLGGVQKAISIPATAIADGSALHVTGEYELDMTAYDIKPPKLMFGRIKVGDKVTVKFDLLLKS